MIRRTASLAFIYCNSVRSLAGCYIISPASLLVLSYTVVPRGTWSWSVELQCVETRLTVVLNIVLSFDLRRHCHVSLYTDIDASKSQDSTDTVHCTL